MDPGRPRSEIRTYPHPPPPHHHQLPTSYVFIQQNGDAGDGVPVPFMEQPFHLNMSGTIPDYSNPRGNHGVFLQPQVHQLPPNVQQSPPRSILIDHQPRLHYHQQYDNPPPPPQQIEHLNDDQAELSTEDFIYQGNTESMINDSVNEAFLTTAASSMSINDANVHGHLQHQQPVNYSSPSDRNIYNFTYNTDQCVTSIPPRHPPEGVLDLSKADALTLTQLKEEQEVSPSPLPHETQYQQHDNSLPVPFDLSQGQQASVIVHTDNISPSSRSSVHETNSEECGAFQILTTSTASPAKDRRFRAFHTNRPSNPYLHANHFENPNLHQQQIPFHHHQFNNIMSEISADQKPTLATNHLIEPVINYEAAAPITSSSQQLWSGDYIPQNQLVSPSRPHLHSANASQSLSAIVDMNNQISQRHFSENSVVSEQLLHHRLTQNNVPAENHYHAATTTTPTNFSPGTLLEMMHADGNYVHPTTSTPVASPKKTKSPRNSGTKMGRGRGNFANQIPGSPDVTALFQNAQTHHNHQSTSGYPDIIDPIEGKTPKKGRGRGKKVIAKALNISSAESDFGTVAADVNNVDLNKSSNVFTQEELQRQVENGEVVIKKKRSYKKRAPKSLNNSVDTDSSVSPEKPIRKSLGPKLNRKDKSDQLISAQSQQEYLPNFESITRGVLNVDDNLSSPSQVISLDSSNMGRGSVRGLGVRRSTSEGRGRGVRRSIGEGRGRGVRRSTGEGRGRGVRRSAGEGRGRGVRRSTGEGRGRGSRHPPASRINEEVMGSQTSNNAVGMVIPSQQEVPWVGPPPLGSNEFSTDSVSPYNHTGLYPVNQATLSKPFSQNQKKHRVTVGGKPFDVSERIISKTRPVPNTGVIPSNQFASTSVQSQMAETGDLPMSCARVVQRSRASSKAKGHRKSFQPKVNLEHYKGSDDEVDSNAEDEDDDDEDYEDLEKRQRITRRKSGRKQKQVGFAEKGINDFGDQQETLYFTWVPSQVNGLRNEMPVSLENIKKEGGNNEDPLEQQQHEAEKVVGTGTGTSDLLQQSVVPSEDSEGIQNVKQEIVDEEAEGDTGISEMQVDTEGTFGDAESGLVAATIVDVKPAVRKLNVKNRRIFPPPQRQLKRPIKKPRIPLREPLGVGFTPRGVEKRGRKKKSVYHEEVVVKTEEIEGKPRELVGKTEKLVIPKFTDDEKQLLYSDKKFVIDISSVDKTPDSIFIWQIIQSENCLRQYYPSKYAEKQFFISSPVKWYFFEEEFKSDEFYSRFIPIVVITANIILQNIERQGKKLPSEECTVQYVYVDKPFFVRMLKCIGKIDTIEFTRTHFMASLSVLALIAVEPLFFNRIDFKNLSNDERFKGTHHSWEYVGTYLKTILDRVCEKFPFQQEILEHLKDYPSMILSTKDVNKSELCSACKRSVPCVAVKFPTRGHMDKPYDIKTLIELAPEHFPQPPEPMNFCRGCSNAAKKLHRLIHFRHNLLKLIKQNIAKDVATFHKYQTQITQNILLWMQEKDISWKNVLFLEFQICVTEVQAEFFPRSPKVVVDAPIPTPTPIINPDAVVVVPNEM